MKKYREPAAIAARRKPPQQTAQEYGDPAEQLRMAEALMAFGTWEWNVVTGKVTCTPGLEAIYGLSAGTFGGTYQDFARRVHPDDLAEVERVRDRALRQGDIFDQTFRILREDGAIRWVRSRASALQDDRGNIARVIGINIDVTEQIILEQKAATNQVRLATALKLSDLSVFHQDPQLRYTWFANTKLGTSLEETIGRTDAELFGTQVARPLQVIKRRVLRTGRGERQEVWLTRNGQAGCFDLIVEPEQNQGGGISGVICAATDITVRKRAELAVKLQAELLQNLPVGVNMVDAQAILRFTNPKFDALFGYLPGELIGQHASILNAPGREHETAAEIMQALISRGCWHGELQNRRKDGSLFWSYAELTSTRHPEYGQIWICVQADITELREARTERDAAFAAINRLSDHIHDQVEMERQEFAREVHDEIGATLTGIRMRVDATQVPIDANVLQSVRADIDRAIDATRAICSRLRPPMLDDLGLTETLRWYARDWSRQTGLRIRFRLGQGLSEPADPLRIDLFRIVQELLTNVARHAGAQSVKVYLGRVGQNLKLCVSDDGRGFAAGAQEGYGLLGLRERLRRHHGTLLIDTSEQGSKIILRIPVT